MSDGGTRGRVKLGELIDAALAPAEPAAHAGFVVDLAVVTRTADAITAVSERLLVGGDRGRRVFLEWLARLRVRPPAAVLDWIPPLLADPTLPDDLRVRVAARAIRVSHDPKGYLSRLVPALTAGLSPLDSLSRLRAVQGRLRRSKALDAVIARRERRLRLACPRCGLRLRRVEVTKHLYEAHGLILDGGRARRPDLLLKELRKRYAAVRDTTALDQAAQLSDPAALRAWAARTGTPPADVNPLAVVAADRGNGLCPRCLAELPPSVSLLPPPLVLSHGRLSGDGYTVGVRGPDGLRTCTIATPAGVVRSGLDGGRAIGPRAAGLLAAAAILAAAIVLRMPPPWALLVAAVAYFAARFVRASLPPADDRAVDRAWSDLVPRLSAGLDTDRLLVRLCRASVGRGEPDARAAALHALATRTTLPSIRAAARFLQLDDAGRYGVDRVAAAGELIAEGLRGYESVPFAEHVAELFLTRDPPPTPADRARLRVLALDAAFAAGLTPRGLADLWAACPHLRDLTAVEPLSRLGLQYAVWTAGDDPPWQGAVVVGTVFELARVAPTLSGRLLSDHPDLLLYHRPPPAVDESLGWALVCARGVVVGGKNVADTDVEIRVDGGRLIGAATLAFGPHRLTLPRRPPGEFVTTLRQLLLVRSEVLLPRLDAALAPGRTRPELIGLARPCTCGANVLVSAGRVGRVVRGKDG